MLFLMFESLAFRHREGPSVFLSRHCRMLFLQRLRRQVFKIISGAVSAKCSFFSSAPSAPHVQNFLLRLWRQMFQNVSSAQSQTSSESGDLFEVVICCITCMNNSSHIDFRSKFWKEEVAPPFPMSAASSQLQS